MSSKELTAIIKDIKKKYGDVIKNGSELLEKRKDYKLVSISPALDLVLKGGIREGSWLMLSGAPKSGKAQPLTSLVYTPDGPVPMGELSVGDEICGPNGGVGKVLNIFPQGMRKVYRLTFSDGSKCVADGCHLWKVRVNRPDSPWEIRTTEELMSKVSYPDRDKWIIPNTHLEFKPKAIPLNPFLLGIILMDGLLKDGKLYINCSQERVRTEVDTMLLQYNAKLNEDNSVDSPFILSTIMSYMDQPQGKKDFHIPNIYKYNHTEMRLSLLRGIICAAGYQHPNGYYEIEKGNRQLADDITELARTLGFAAYLNPRNETSYRITINTSKYDLFHQRQLVEPRNKHYKTISYIEAVGEELCQCIEVQGTDSLYITDGVSVTHNTTTAMQLALNCQMEGRPVIYLNTEGRLSELNFEVKGLDPKKMQIITAEDTPLSAETFLDILMQLISVKENEGALCIIDSVSSLIPERELSEDVTGMARPTLPKVLSNFVKKAGQIVPNNKIIMVMITHLISNTSGYGPSKMADSGIKIQFQSDTRMEVKSVTPWKPKDDQIGQAIEWKIYYSSTGTTGTECQSWIRYGEGIDKTQELIVIAEELALVSKAGSWYTCDFLADHPKLKEWFPKGEAKVQGQENLYQFFSSTPEAFAYLNDKIKELLL